MAPPGPPAPAAQPAQAASPHHAGRGQRVRPRGAAQAGRREPGVHLRPHRRPRVLQAQGSPAVLQAHRHGVRSLPYLRQLPHRLCGPGRLLAVRAQDLRDRGAEQQAHPALRAAAVRGGGAHVPGPGAGGGGQGRREPVQHHHAPAAERGHPDEHGPPLLRLPQREDLRVGGDALPHPRDVPPLQPVRDRGLLPGAGLRGPPHGPAPQDAGRAPPLRRRPGQDPGREAPQAGRDEGRRRRRRRGVQAVDVRGGAHVAARRARHRASERRHRESPDAGDAGGGQRDAGGDHRVGHVGAPGQPACSPEGAGGDRRGGGQRQVRDRGRLHQRQLPLPLPRAQGDVAAAHGVALDPAQGQPRRLPDRRLRHSAQLHHLHPALGHGPRPGAVGGAAGVQARALCGQRDRGQRAAHEPHSLRLRPPHMPRPRLRHEHGALHGGQAGAQLRLAAPQRNEAQRARHVGELRIDPSQDHPSGSTPHTPTLASCLQNPHSLELD